MKHRGWPAALCLALCVALALPSRGDQPVIYLMAVNDTVVETTAENMPTVSGGILYVPYTILSSRTHGINLGVSVQYNAARGTVMVYSNRYGVTFDTRNNSAADLDGNEVDARAVVRGSMVFVPLEWICGYFSVITYTITRTGSGTLIRITNSAAILSTADFVDAAKGMLHKNYTALTTVEPPEPSQEPDPVESAPAVGDGPEVYLGLRWGVRTEDAAQRLERAGQRALFLFTPAELAEQDGLVRALVGAGHTVGLVLEGDSAETCLSQAREGAALLAHIARRPVQVVSAGGLDDGGRKELAQAGYVLWDANVDGDGAATGTALLRRLSPGRVNRVSLTCGEQGFAALSAAMGTLVGPGYRLTQPTAPALQK